MFAFGQDPALQSNLSHRFDHTGQVAPRGVEPRVTATPWEDEGTLCFQVEAKSVCVARRGDNHMINGTKLLNVVGMSRGRRDGILKSEKTRHVVKIGPMHLKGVWIPFEAALRLANIESITKSVYPLFVYNIASLCSNPQEQDRHSVGSATMAAVGRPRSDSVQTAQRYLAGPTTSQPTAFRHHNSMSNPIDAAVSQPAHTVQLNPSAGLNSLGRAHTSPTPLTSAMSLMGVGDRGSSYDCDGAKPLSTNTGLNSARSVPNTRAITPPVAVQQAISYPLAQSYDGDRPMHSALIGKRNDSQHRKTEMAPLSKIIEVPDENNDQASALDGDEGDHKQGHRYTRSSALYIGNRSDCAYNRNGAQGSMHHEHPHLVPETTGSPHQNGSSHATLRTISTEQAWSSGYPISSVRPFPRTTISVMNSGPCAAHDDNAYHNGCSGPTQDANQGYAASNGMRPAKRGRDDKDEEVYHPENVESVDIGALKRRKTMEGSVAGPYAQRHTYGNHHTYSMQVDE